MHPVILSRAAALAIIAVIAASLLTGTGLGDGLNHGYIWIISGLLLLRLTWRAARWYRDWLVVTSERIMLVSGMFRRKATAIWLAKLTRAELRHTRAGRLLGYGELILSSPSATATTLARLRIPYPEQITMIINREAFPGSLPGVTDSPPDFTDPEVSPGL